MNRLQFWWFCNRTKPSWSWLAWLIRACQGAILRNVISDWLYSWPYSVDGCQIDISGGCPVQGFGTVDGHPCYFRARGEGWSFEVAPLGVGTEIEPLFETGDRCYVWPVGGWIGQAEVCRVLRIAISRWRQRRQ